jgi:hypothetical protein
MQMVLPPCDTQPKSVTASETACSFNTEGARTYARDNVVAVGEHKGPCGFFECAVRRDCGVGLK